MNERIPCLLAWVIPLCAVVSGCGVGLDVPLGSSDGSSFDPRSIPGIILWNKASYYSATHSNSQFLVAGDTWADANGSSITLAPVGGNPVFWTGVGPNGTPSIQLTGATEFHRNATNLTGGATGLTIFMVAAKNVGSGGDLFGANNTGTFAAGGGVDYVKIGGAATLSAFTISSAGSTYTTSTLTVDGSYHVHEAIWDPSNSPTQLYYSISKVGNQVLAAGGISSLILSDYVHLGGPTQLTGYISEILIYGRALNDTEKAQVRDYFFKIYGDI